MTQRQLDIRAGTYEPNTIQLDINHTVKIKKKGRHIGIYTLSGVERKKRGVSLPVEAWMLLQQHLPLINLTLQFVSGTVGVEVFEKNDGYNANIDYGSYNRTTNKNGYGSYNDNPSYDVVNYGEEAFKPDTGHASMPASIYEWKSALPIEQSCVQQQFQQQPPCGRAVGETPYYAC
jgi:hypothetical protein